MISSKRRIVSSTGRTGSTTWRPSRDVCDEPSEMITTTPL